MRSGYKNCRDEHSLYPYVISDDRIRVGKNEPRKFFYETLLQVNINHNYYNGSDNLCADFILSPTTDCAQLLADLGLLFKVQKTGFSIVYNTRSKRKLYDYLDNQKELGYWSRLSFIGFVDNAYFVNFSEMNFNTNPAVKNFYLSNTQAHSQQGDEAVLNTKDFVTQPTQGYFDTVPVQFSVKFGSATRIDVLDISGRIVFSYPRCAPEEMFGKHRFATVNTTVVKEYMSQNPTAECDDRVMVYIDLSTVPQGLYCIEWYEDDVLLAKQNVIYTDVSKVPFMFMDLMFYQPEGEQEGIYPVNLEDRVITPINYQINFEHRFVYWLYWIVPQPWQTITNMNITDDSSVNIKFDGPYPGQLPDGSPAWYFVSEQRLALEQVSPYRFNLNGQLDGATERILIGPMPVASGTQLLSEFGDDPAEKYSAIYVYL